MLFALLTDFGDADTETLPEDEEMIRYATAAIEKLNAKYGLRFADSDIAADSTTPNWRGVDFARDEKINAIVEGTQLFYLLHRKRLWNQSEGKVDGVGT